MSTTLMQNQGQKSGKEIIAFCTKKTHEQKRKLTDLRIST
jgi:hypothetical protein